MINLQKRSQQKELLDGGNIPFKDIRRNMKELNTINTFLGGHKISIAGTRAMISKGATGKEISICEIGCGGGDNLYALSVWCKRNNIRARFTGIDIKPECIEFARMQYPNLNASWICSDYKLADLRGHRPDIIFSSLFCHHFTDAELVQMVHWMSRNSNTGFFINDLHRHPAAYYAIKILASLFSRSYLVKNDAPLSVARGFRASEWKNILDGAGLANYRIRWKWAFRHLIICKNG